MQATERVGRGGPAPALEACRRDDGARSGGSNRRVTRVERACRGTVIRACVRELRVSRRGSTRGAPQCGCARPPTVSQLSCAMSKSMAQQHREKVLRVLGEAGERPVSIVELRERGVPNPASVIYELELAGFAIDRVHRHGRLVGVRLLERGEELEPPKRRRRFGR
jgi:hypothetical protein